VPEVFPFSATYRLFGACGALRWWVSRVLGVPGGGVALKLRGSDRTLPFF
jgi:hypothetical protein